MRTYSYVVAQDYGFAPNPFHGTCTLATCKPKIRKLASVGDFIIGTGAAASKRSGRLVFYMRVERIITFDAYWNDLAFHRKIPNMYGSRKQAYGDNIYHRHPRTRKWIQADSYHSKPGGRANPLNVDHDTQSENVLIASEFSYWGGDGPTIPGRFMRGDNAGLFSGRGHRVLPERLAASLIEWIRSLNQQGCAGTPLDWRRWDDRQAQHLRP